MPPELWLVDVSRVDATSAFGISDPVARYDAVNGPRAAAKQVPRTLAPSDDERGAPAVSVGVVDLHFQSVRTAPVVLETKLTTALHAHAEVWVVTGTGHHTAAGSHQKGGGVLFNTVEAYLNDRGYAYYIGKDSNGHTGAFLVAR